ncbi:protein PSK SIMULATOR 1-like [Henckelia pumila]|uniref:protein PSK SIMULATOR 1-like n=1 Tax=Henckelia pumila TaxID=405737 RepID=UPI003C6E2604
MVDETVTDSWLSNIWKSSRKTISQEPDKPVIGILSLEVSRFMLNIVNMWQYLSDEQIFRLREEMANSVGIQKLVSEKEDPLMDLALAEMLENFERASKSVAILGKKCADPTYHNLDRVFYDPGEIDPKWCRWNYRIKKMEKKVKRMKSFVGATEQMCQELEVLAELEQNLKQIQVGANLGEVKVLEFQHKVLRQQQEVQNLREMSPWVRTYDYTVRLLLRSLFTVAERIKNVCGINQFGHVEGIKNDEQIHGNYLIHNNSALIQPSVNPSKNTLSRFPNPMGRSFSNLGLKNRTFLGGSYSSILCGKQHEMKTKRFAPVGYAGCMGGGCESPIVENYVPSRGSSFRSYDSSQKDTDEKKDTSALPTLYDILNPKKVPFFISKRRVLNAPPSTLGHSALALHYAKVIILIEKLASSPHLISLDARDELYNMLPANIRSCLKARLKTFSRTFTLSKYDANDAARWTLALETILEWLSPLAHNMVRWQSERNIEGQRPSFGSNVLLVQTLYFANQVKIEAAIVELLIGLSYLSRYGSMACGNCLYPRDKNYYDVVDRSLSGFTRADN